MTKAPGESRRVNEPLRGLSAALVTARAWVGAGTPSRPDTPRMLPPVRQTHPPRFFDSHRVDVGLRWKHRGSGRRRWSALYRLRREARTAPRAELQAEVRQRPVWTCASGGQRPVVEVIVVQVLRRWFCFAASSGAAVDLRQSLPADAAESGEAPASSRKVCRSPAHVPTICGVARVPETQVSCSCPPPWIGAQSPVGARPDVQRAGGALGPVGFV